MALCFTSAVNRLYLIRLRLEITLKIVWAMLLVGFMIITPSIKSPLTKFLTLRADAGASKCEEKVKTESWYVAGCCSYFYNYHALRLGAKIQQCKVASLIQANSQSIHHCRDSVNTYLLQLAAASRHCGKK